MNFFSEKFGSLKSVLTFDDIKQTKTENMNLINTKLTARQLRVAIGTDDLENIATNLNDIEVVNTGIGVEISVLGYVLNSISYETLKEIQTYY